MTLKKRMSKLRERAFRPRQERPGGSPSKPRRSRPEGDGPTRQGKGSAAIAAVVMELGKLVREMLAIPAGIYMALAELAGRGVLVAWRRVLWPAALVAWALLGAIYRLALREVTPARAVFALALAAAVALGASQWLDYRGISIGTDAYEGDLGLVAPAPEIDRVAAGDAHSWVMVPLAVASLVALGAALLGRPRSARLLILFGLVAIGVALFVDVPKGLDEGSAAVAYEGASAHLLEGFWLQLASAVALIACGLLLPGYLRSIPAPAPEPRGPGRMRRLAGAAAARAEAAAREAARKRARGRRARPQRRAGRRAGGGGAGAPPRGAPS